MATAHQIQEDLKIKTSDVNILAHTTWDCKYHLGFVPKFADKRKKYSASAEAIENRACVRHSEREQSLPVSVLIGEDKPAVKPVVLILNAAGVVGFKLFVSVFFG